MMRNIFSMINHCPSVITHDCVPATAAWFYCSFAFTVGFAAPKSVGFAAPKAPASPTAKFPPPLRFFSAAPTGLFPPPLRGSIVLSHLPWVSRHRGCLLHPRLNSLRPYGAFSTALRAVKCCLWQLYNVLLAESTCHPQG